MAPAQHIGRAAALLLAVVMTSLSCLAYTISGNVTDSEGELLPQASIRLFKIAKDSTYVGGVTTDIKGHFSLGNLKNGKYSLEVSDIGYETTRQPVALNGANV